MAARHDAKKTILVLDDEPHVVTYLETLLRDNGYETASASNGKEGMEKAKSEKIDLVCLDISMPERSGTRVYKELKSDPDLARIPVVIVTALTKEGGDPYKLEEIVSSPTRLPAPDGYFTKPIDRDEFLRKIHSLLQ